MNADFYEQDYRPTASAVAGRFVDGTTIEVIREGRPATPPRHVLFDFDGTLSLVRQGWMDVMVPMMVQYLRQTPTRETGDQLSTIAREFVMELTGKQTIYQMMRLAAEVAQRGGNPLDPLQYKQDYHDRLMERIASRRESLRSGRCKAEEMLVPGSVELLEGLRGRGATLYLASGTDEHYVREEVELLGLTAFFGRHVYGAQDDHKAFSKAMVIQRILRENNVDGSALVGFGDGYVEIQNVAAVGGTTVAVASDEVARSGRPDEWKRHRLIGAGADIVVPDYQDHAALNRYLWKE